LTEKNISLHRRYSCRKPRTCQ